MDEKEMEIKGLKRQLKHLKREHKAKLNKAKGLLRTVLSLLEFEQKEWKPYWGEIDRILGSSRPDTGDLYFLNKEVRNLENQIEQLLFALKEKR